MVQEKRHVIIDTDPGIDDAVALALALFDERLQVDLITTVSGNVGIENVTNNTLKLLAHFKKEVPVAKGAVQALVRDSKDAGHVHGETGLAGYVFRDSYTQCLLSQHAVNAMYDVLMRNETTTILALGPLTNIALLLKMYPECVDKIDELVWMGGAFGRGNVGIYTEFNSGFDPEATKIVMTSSLKKTMVGLEMGDAARLTTEMRQAMKQTNDIGDMLYQLLEGYSDDGSVYDSTAVGYLLHPEFFTTKHANINVEIMGEYTAGATLVDFNNPVSHTKVCTDVDAPRFLEWLLQAIGQMR